MPQTVDEFLSFLLYVKANPGYNQVDYSHLTGLDKIKVNRFVKAALKHNVLQKSNRALFIGAALLPNLIRSK